MRFVIGQATDQGRTRAKNEDSSLVDADQDLYAVADGMGGHRGGDVASQTAIEGLRAAFAAGASIDEAIARANDAVIARAASDDDLYGMGTTLTAVTPIGGNRLLVGHVGDSRAYLLKNEEPHALVRVTDDHSLVEELVRDGRLTPEQAESHPQRAIVTRALGVDADVEVDTYELEMNVGDRVVLCSDGLTTMIRERDVERIALGEGDPQRAAQLLVDAANDAGGEDNITVVVIDIVELDEMPAADAAVVPPVEPVTAITPAVVETVEPRAKRRPIRTGMRVVLVLLPVVLILAIAAAAIGWYARDSYYVGASNGEVVIFKGVPGGVLGWDPTVDSRTGIRLDDLTQLDRHSVETNSTKGSLETAEQFVARLRGAVAPSSTTTVKPPRTTTTRRPSRTTTTRRPRTTTTRRP
jgi:protein phosphatase